MKFFCTKQAAGWYWYSGKVDEFQITNPEFAFQVKECNLPAHFHIRGRNKFFCYGHAMMLGEIRVRPAFWRKMETIDEFNARILDAMIISRHNIGLIGFTAEETSVVYSVPRQWP